MVEQANCKWSKEGKLTSWHNPDTAFAERKLVDLETFTTTDIDGDFALVDKEGHLHLAAVLGSLEPCS